MSVQPGSDFAGYRVEDVAGRGGMSVVYRAIEPGLERPVALKVISPELAVDETFRARFERESRLAASLDHPNVIPVHAAGEHEGLLYIAMRYVEGPDLRRVLADRGALAPPTAALVVAQVASALQAAHARGLVHRDVKPGNILLTDLSDAPHVYLTDFGIARPASATGDLTSAGEWVGTPDFAAPEQVEGRQAGAAADVYSLGCVLFTALTGRPPFEREGQMAKAWAHVHDDPQPLRAVRHDVPPAFEEVVRCALAKRPEHRYGSARELGLAAVAAADGAGHAPIAVRLREQPEVAAAQATPDSRQAPAPAPGAPPTPSYRLHQRRRRRWQPTRRRTAFVAGTLAGVAVVALVLALTTGALPGVGGSSEPEPAPPAPPDPAGDTVRCATGLEDCTQADTAVSAPPEGGSCEIESSPGTWTQVDRGGADTIYACLLDEDPPSLPAGEASTVPDLADVGLDFADRVLSRQGLDYEPVGDDLFGLIDSEALTVCQTDPEAGAAVETGDEVTLFIDSSC